MFAEDCFLELWPIHQNYEIETRFEKLMLAIFIYKGKIIWVDGFLTKKHWFINECTTI